jgi:hypothetical protein
MSLVRGSRAVGLAVAAALVAGVVLLPALVVVAFYAFANVQALLTGPDLSSETLNVPVFLTGLALTVATLVVLIAVGVGLIGRSLSPERRAEDPLDIRDPLEP